MLSVKWQSFCLSLNVWRWWIGICWPPGHFLNQCWCIVEYTQTSNIQLDFDQNISFKKIHFKMSSAKQLSCWSGLSISKYNDDIIMSDTIHSCITFPDSKVHEANRTQVGPMLAPWTLLSWVTSHKHHGISNYWQLDCLTACSYIAKNYRPYH